VDFLNFVLLFHFIKSCADLISKVLLDL